MSTTTKITDLPVLTSVNANTDNTVFVVVDKSSGTFTTKQVSLTQIDLADDNIAPTALVTADAAFAKANAANVLAQAAFNAANTSQADATGAFAKANSANIHAEAAYVHANAGFNFANSANVLAQAAFDAANSASSSSIDSTARITANAAFNRANSSNITADASYAFANTVNVKVDAAFAQANAANVLAQAAFNQANTGLTANSVATLNNKTFDVSVSSNNTFSIQGQSISSYSGSGQVLILQNSPTISVLNLSDSQLNLDGGTGSLYWSGQSGVAQAGDLKAGVYSSDPSSNNSLFTFGGAGANNMSVGIEGSLFIGTAMPSNNGGLNTTYPGWLVVQSGAKFGGDIDTLGGLNLSDPTNGDITFSDSTVQNTAWTGSVNDLTISGSVFENFETKANANSVVTHDCSNTSIFYHTTPNTNWTANFTNLNLPSGKATSLTLIIAQGATAYIANVVQIGASAQTIKWSANTVPTGNANAVDVQSFSIINNGGTYTVLGQLSTFG